MNPSEANEPAFNRRDFLKGSSLATMMTMMGGVELFAQAEPKKEGEAKPPGPKIKCALIGLGAWGREILDQVGRIPLEEPPRRIHRHLRQLPGHDAPQCRQSAGRRAG